MLTLAGFFFAFVPGIFADSILLRAGENNYTGFTSAIATSDFIRFSGRKVPIFLGRCGPSGKHAAARNFLTFDLAPLKAQAGNRRVVVQKVSLSYFKTSGASVPMILDLCLVGDGTSAYQLKDSGDDTTNWEKAPTEPGGTIGELLSQSDTHPREKTGVITFDSSPAFVSAVGKALGGDGVLRLVTSWNGEGSSKPPGDRLLFLEGGEASDAAHRPSLTIEYTLAP